MVKFKKRTSRVRRKWTWMIMGKEAGRLESLTTVTLAKAERCLTDCMC